MGRGQSDRCERVFTFVSLRIGGGVLCFGLEFPPCQRGRKASFAKKQVNEGFSFGVFFSEAVSLLARFHSRQLLISSSFSKATWLRLQTKQLYNSRWRCNIPRSVKNADKADLNSFREREQTTKRGTGTVGCPALTKAVCVTLTLKECILICSWGTAQKRPCHFVFSRSFIDSHLTFVGV